MSPKREDAIPPEIAEASLVTRLRLERKAKDCYAVFFS
jgi:hypothetical protein